jgi:hypothetical protein
MLLVLTFAAIPALAQKTTNPEVTSPVIEKMKAEIGRMAIDYWQPKLNRYKVRIDEILTPNDRAELDRLRVRWGVLLGDQLNAEAATNEVAGDGETVEIEVNADNGEQIMAIFFNAMQIAERYRSQLDDLGQTVMEDVGTFADNLDEATGTFISAHHMEIANDEQAQTLTVHRDELRTTLEELRSPEGREEMSMVYSFAIEPIILLYNGSDLRQLLQDMVPQGTAGITGLTFPERSALSQNFPNPASTSTTITCSLTEASTTTVLRIYDSQGKLEITRDLGALAAGDHNVRLDVSNLASGSYLYHLSMATSSGEQVFAKTMKIVR